MKLSKETLEILNNFRDINQSIVVYPGNKIRTKSEDSRIFAEAITEETFTREFAIYNIKEFLSAYNILGDPELIFSEDDYVILRDGRNELKYYFCPLLLVTSPDPKRNLQVDNKDICFNIPQAQFNRILRMTTFDSDRKNWVVNFVCDGGEILLNVYHKNEPSKCSYRSLIGNSPHKFSIKFFLESLAFINGDYDIVASKSYRYIEAFNTKRNLRYVMTYSPETTFDY